MEILRRFSHNGWILFFYLLVTLGLTYPLVTHLFTSIYGLIHDNVDTLNYMWAIQNVVYGGESFESYSFRNFPSSFNLIDRYPMYTAELFVWFFALLIPSPVLGFNLLMITKFTFACFSMYLLIKHLTGNKAVAFISGAIYGFSPYFPLMALAYGPIFIPVFLPIFLWTLMRMLEQPSQRKLFECSLAFILFFGEQFYYSYYLLVTFLVVSPFLLVFMRRDITLFFKNVWAARTGKRYLGTLLFFAIALAAFTPLLLDFREDVISARSFTPTEAVERSATPMFYTTPSIGNALLGDPHSMDLWGVAVSINLENYELGLYLGILPVSMLLLAWFFRSRLSRRQKNYLLLLSLMTGASIFLALGLHPFNKFYTQLVTSDMRNWESPTRVFYDFAPMFRFLSRYHAITITCLVAGSALGFMLIMNIFKKWWWAQKVVYLGLAIGLCLEYINWSPRNVTHIWKEMPQAYKELTKLKESVPILELPRRDFPTMIHHIAWQVFHKKKIAGDLLSPIYHTVDVKKKGDVERLKKDGFKYVVVSTKLEPVRRYPWQKPFPDVSMKEFNEKYELEHLTLVKKFPDSVLYRVE